MQRVAADQVAGLGGEAQLHGLAAVVVGGHVEKYGDAGRQVLAPWARRAKAAAAARDEPGLLRFEQVRRITRDPRRAQLLEELQVVEHPEAASECGEDYGMLLGLNLNVAYADCGKIDGQRLPLLAAVETEVNRRASSGEEQIGVVGILAHALDVLVLRQAGGELGPMLAEVGGLVDVRMEIIPVEAARGDVSRATFGVRRLDARDCGPFWQRRRADLSPVLACVGGYVDQAVVGACPDDVVCERRKGDRGDGVEHFFAGDVGDDGAAWTLLLGFVVTGEVGADHFPVDAFVEALEENVRAHQQLLWISGSKHNRVMNPAVAVFDFGACQAELVFRPEAHVGGQVRAAILLPLDAVIAAAIGDPRLAGRRNHPAHLSALYGVPNRRNAAARYGAR